MAAAYGIFILIIMANLFVIIRKSRSMGVKNMLNFFQDGCRNGKM